MQLLQPRYLLGDRTKYGSQHIVTAQTISGQEKETVWVDWLRSMEGKTK
jgi:hypothetical protein